MEHKWFKSYLSGRSQSVSVDGHLSDPLPISIGVLQGSILGPLLFLLFFNDLPTVTESCETNMYADDTEIDSASKSDCPEELENNLNSYIFKISEHFNINRLSLNVPKCEFILIGTYRSLSKMPEMSIHINNEPLHKVTISIYLGMFIDSNLKWDDHINNMIPKISAKIGIIKSLRNIVPTNNLIQNYNAIVQLYLGYGDTVYNTASQTKCLCGPGEKLWEASRVTARK